MTEAEAARIVALRLREAGHEALFAGGCVRDGLLGHEPDDWDVATSATPDVVQELFERTVPIGERFGCVQVHPAPHVSVEVTSFRTEGGYADGRRPDAVAFGTDPAEDARRRDFTVNALFQDPETGAVIDHVGGREDFALRVIRAVGDPHRRFAEDRLRMLRAVRFAARLGWRIDPPTLAAIRAHAPAVADVSPERIRDELHRLLTEGGASRGLELLRQSGLLAVILPEVDACRGVRQPPEFHPEGDVFVHTRLALAGLDLAPGRPSFTLAFGTLLHDIGKPPTFAKSDRIRFDGHDRVGARMAEDIGRRLHFSRRQRETVRDLVAKHMQFRNLPLMREAKLRRFLADEHIDEHLALHRVDCMAAHGDPSLYDFCVAKRTAIAAEAPRPRRLVTGHDLIARGLEPGPRFARLLAALEDEVLEGRVRSRAEALAWLDDHATASLDGDRVDGDEADGENA